MEELLLRFSHLGINIFDSLESKDIANCRNVSRTWNSFIEEQKFYWLRIIPIIPMVQVKMDPQKWKKIKVENLREFVRKLLSESAIEYKYGTHKYHTKSMTMFHFACIHGDLDIVEMLIIESPKINLDLNAKDFRRHTGFSDH